MTQASSQSTTPTWKFGDLTALLKSRGLPDCKEFLDSYVWKHLRFGFHADREKAVWDQLMATQSPIDVTGDDLSKLMFEAETHVEAAAGVLDSLGDILAQVINRAVLRSVLTERAVSMKSVNTKLKTMASTAALSAAIDRYMACPEFDYINAFVNSTKHRRIIKTQFRIATGPIQPKRIGLEIASFTYDAKSFPAMWAEDLINVYEPAVRGHITDIGIELNKYIGTLPQVSLSAPPSATTGMP